MPGGNGGDGDGMADPGRPSEDEKFHGRNHGSSPVSKCAISPRAQLWPLSYRAKVEALTNRGGVAYPQNSGTSALHRELLMRHRTDRSV